MHRKLVGICVCLGGTTASIFAAESISSTDPNDGWRFLKESGAVTLYSRVRAGSSLKEFKAMGEIDAPTRAVWKVIEDVDAYSSFMPYTTEAHRLKTESDSLLAYQRLSPKFIGDRDYILRVRKQSWPMENGVAYLSRWQPANDYGLGERPGVFRVKLCEGSWLLEPAGANKTRAIYSIYTDTGVPGPAFIANHFSEVGIRKLFAALRKQVKNPKYQSTPAASSSPK
jgi:polyketide cyclase/dehydrase/lipid transport protein